MKLRFAALALSVGNAGAFVSRSTFRPVTTTTTSLSAAAAATSFEEDLELTLKAIFKHVGADMSKGGAASAPAASKAATPVVAEEAKVVASPEPTAAASVDLSIPYDAAARLEFDASNKV